MGYGIGLPKIEIGTAGFSTLKAKPYSQREHLGGQHIPALFNCCQTFFFFFVRILLYSL